MSDKKPSPKTQASLSQGFIQPYDLANLGKPTFNEKKLRAEQVSLKDSEPYPDYIKDFNIGLEDIDNALIFHIEKNIKPSIIQNQNKVIVPVIYGSPERWKSIQVDGYFKDKNGKLMFPVIVVKRNDITKDRTIGNKLDGNRVHLYKNFQNPYTQRNIYDNFDELTNRIPVEEYSTVVIPDYVTITYSGVIYTNLVTQMNELIESFEFASDSYWGDKERFMFRAQIDNFTNTNEVNQGEDRAVRCDFNIVIQGYIIPETVNKDIASKKKEFSKSTIRVTEGIVSSLPIDNQLGVQTITASPVLPFSTVYDGDNTIVLNRGGQYTCGVNPALVNLLDTSGSLISSSNFNGGVTGSMVAPNGSILMNSASFGSVSSGGTTNIPVISTGSNPVGSIISGSYVIGNSIMYANGTQVAVIESEKTGSLNIHLDGLPTGSYDSGSNTWNITSPPPSTDWVRPTEWIAIPTLTSLDERFVGVLAIFENSYTQLAWQITGGGTINWGDGTTVAINGSVQNKIYDYASIASTVNVYHDGRNYKQVLVDITRTGAAFTDFRIAAATINAGSPCTFLDIAVSLPSATILALGLNRPIACAERVLVKSMAAAINTGTLTWVFAGATSMRVWEAPTNGINGLLQLGSATAPIDDIGDVTSSVSTAASRYANSWIKAAGNQTFNTATSIQQLFDGNLFIQQIGNITATSSTAGGVAFIRDCKTLHTIGTIDCPLWTSLNLFASGCFLLQNLIFINCANITITTSAFANCYSLQSLILPGLTRGFSVNGTAMQAIALNAMFTSLGTASGAQTIDVRNTPGASTCNTSIATSKGYTVLIA